MHLKRILRCMNYNKNILKKFYIYTYTHIDFLKMFKGTILNYFLEDKEFDINVFLFV